MAARPAHGPLQAIIRQIKIMRNVRLALGFIGTRYEGWQSQKKNKTIQEAFESNLSKILKEKIAVVGCSRTDSGVHAREFVAHFKTSSALPDDKITDALNFYLPKDIVVFQSKTVSPKFHARFDAKSKIYSYKIWNSRVRPLFEESFVLWQPGKLEVSKMRIAAKILVGRHDFSSFMDSQAKEEIKDAIRKIIKIQILKKNELIEIQVEGNGFLRYMVRVVAGTLIEIGRGRRQPYEMTSILKARDRRKAGPTVPAHGLTLIQVKY